MQCIYFGYQLTVQETQSLHNKKILQSYTQASLQYVLLSIEGRKLIEGHLVLTFYSITQQARRNWSTYAIYVGLCFCKTYIISCNQFIHSLVNLNLLEQTSISEWQEHFFLLSTNPRLENLYIIYYNVGHTEKDIIHQ